MAFNIGNNTVISDARGAYITSVNDGPLSGFRNKFINGDMGVDKRNFGATQTIVPNGPNAVYYTVDRWLASATWTGSFPTNSYPQGQRIGIRGYRITGVPTIQSFRFSQRIEPLNCYDLVGNQVTLSVTLSNSLSLPVTWNAYYANTDSTFGGGSVGPTYPPLTRTLFATGSWTNVTPTKARYSATFNVPAAATTGIEIEFSIGALTSGQWSIDFAQLELGGNATPFEMRDRITELNMCQRYYQTLPTISYQAAVNGTSFVRGPVIFPIQMRDTPQWPNSTPPTIGGTLAVSGGNASNPVIENISAQGFTLRATGTNGGNVLVTLTNGFANTEL